MNNKTYSIFGAGAAGLYTAWRLLNNVADKDSKNPKLLTAGDVLELYDWGKYDFSAEDPGTREPGARVCTWHYMGKPGNSYLELGGMRYSKWYGDDCGQAQGHRLVTTVIKDLGLDNDSLPFNEAGDPLLYLRTKNMYNNEIGASNPAPYNVQDNGNQSPPSQGFTLVENMLKKHPDSKLPQTRREWDEFYQNGKIEAAVPESAVFQTGDKLTDIGYWNLMFDRLGSEGYSYADDGNGYNSNVINWNGADAIQNNNEFAPGNTYSTLKHGYSSMFTGLFKAIKALSTEKKVHLNYHPNTRLHSILQVEKEGKKTIEYTYALRSNPNKSEGVRHTDAAWLAMPRFAIDLVAQATRYTKNEGLDVLNNSHIQLYLDSAIMQPSYKVGMFFDRPWWEHATYAPKLEGYVVTTQVLDQLRKEGFPAEYIEKMNHSKEYTPCGPQPVYPIAYVIDYQYTSQADLITGVQNCIQAPLTNDQQQQMVKASVRNTIGPSITDMPMRMAVYFGNNAPDPTGPAVYGMLATYDDEQTTPFFQELEIGPHELRKIPITENYQPLDGPRVPSSRMTKMLRKQLACMHFGSDAEYSMVPEPLEIRYMDWSLPPFNAGYHAWASHVDIGKAQHIVRKPSQAIDKDVDIFIVGETYSNDQGWVEGAYCTSESVLNEFFGIKPLIDPTNYPFICGAEMH